MARKGTIELYDDKSNTKQPHRFRVRAGNGEIIHTSEGYPTPSNRKRAAMNWLNSQRGSYHIKDLTK